MIFKRVFLMGSFALMLGSFSLMLTSPMSLAETRILDSVVAVVEDDVIMNSELRNRLTMIRSALTATGRELPPDDILVRETLDQLILENIQLQRGQRAGVRISDEHLNAALGRIAAQQNMDLDQLRAHLETSGESYQAMRDNLRRELIIQQVQQGSVNQRIQITSDEIDNYLESGEGREMMVEEYRLVHALLPVVTDTPPEEEADIEAYINRAHERIAGGESFNKVIGDSSGKYLFQGGHLDWRKEDDLPSLFADVAPTLKPGETSRPVRSSSGFHLIHLAERRGGSMMVEQTHVRHILLKTSTIQTDEEAQELAASLRDKALAGGDFEALAKEHSEDIGSAAEGGDLGWTNPGQMVPEFENTMKATAIDDISEPFRSQFGWHILQVLDRRQEDVIGTVARNRAGEVLHQRKYQEELDAWLRKIRDEAFVDIK